MSEDIKEQIKRNILSPTLVSRVLLVDNDHELSLVKVVIISQGPQGNFHDILSSIHAVIMVKLEEQH